MSGFTKLVPEIIQSSIWNESSDVRVVWITMLAVKDAGGYVRGDVNTIARLANVPLDIARTALEKFQAPDTASHTPDNEGRRIEAAPGGWVVLNHELYRIRDHQAEHAEYVRNWRKNRETSADVKKCESQVNHPSASVSASASSREGGCKGESKAIPTREQAQAYASEIGFDGWEGWFDHFESNGWKVSGKAPMKDWKAGMRNGKRRERENARPDPTAGAM